MSRATRAARLEEIRDVQAGSGIFILRNKTASDLILPKPSLDTPPMRQISAYGRFTGDSYHIKHLRGLVEIVQVVDSDERPEPPSPQISSAPQAESKPSKRGSVGKDAVGEI